MSKYLRESNIIHSKLESEKERSQHKPLKEEKVSDREKQQKINSKFGEAADAVQSKTGESEMREKKSKKHCY